jgi:hypothetical protein
VLNNRFAFFVYFAAAFWLLARLEVALIFLQPKQHPFEFSLDFRQRECKRRPFSLALGLRLDHSAVRFHYSFRHA